MLPFYCEHINAHLHSHTSNSFRCGCNPNVPHIFTLIWFDRLLTTVYEQAYTHTHAHNLMSDREKEKQTYSNELIRKAMCAQYTQSTQHDGEMNKKINKWLGLAH